MEEFVDIFPNTVAVKKDAAEKKDDVLDRLYQSSVVGFTKFWQKGAGRPKPTVKVKKYAQR